LSFSENAIANAQITDKEIVITAVISNLKLTALMFLSFLRLDSGDNKIVNYLFRLFSFLTG
jgi:hypothetical protein